MVLPPPFIKSAKGGVEIIYRKRIGPHEITVLKANRSEDLVDWLNKYIIRNRLYVSEKSFTKYIKVLKITSIEATSILRLML